MMKLFLALLCFLSLSLPVFAQNSSLSIGTRVIYNIDGATGVITYRDNDSACVQFDRARPDGVFERCNISLRSLSADTSRGSSTYITQGSRIIYTPDGASGVVTRVDRGSACVRFDYARPDGAYERCNIGLNLLALSDRGPSRPPRSLSVGQRVIYTVDSAPGTITYVNGYSACVRFDYPRPDGAYERCDISLGLLVESGRENPGRTLSRGSRIIYTVDGARGVVTSVYNATACVRFDRARSDGVYDRCGISLSLLRLDR